MEKNKWILRAVIVIEAVLLIISVQGEISKKILSLGIIIGLSTIVALAAGILSRAPFLKRLHIVMIVSLSFGIIGGILGDADTRGSSGSKKVCAYCNKRFSGKGYYHIGTSCELESGNGWEGNHCSMKCCSEDWCNNGINSK